MNNFFETMNNCRAYLNNHSDIASSFEHMASSSYDGFEYFLKNGMSVKILLDKKSEFLIMEVFPGITARDGYQTLVCEYCQSVSDVSYAGYLAVDTDQGNVYFHIATSMHDNAVTAKLLNKMEHTAIDMLNKHTPIIERLAYGRLPELGSLVPKNPAPASTTSIEVTEDQVLLDYNIAQLRDALCHSGHNVVAQSLDHTSTTVFYQEILTMDMRCRDFIHIHNDGWMVRSVRLDIKCEEPFRGQLAQYCNKLSDMKTVGFIKVASDGYPYCSIGTYVLDGENPISRETLLMTDIIVKVLLKNCEEKIRCIGHGVTPPDDEMNDALMRAVANGLMDRMSNHATPRDNKNIESSNHTDSTQDLKDLLNPETDSDDDMLDF